MSVSNCDDLAHYLAQKGHLRDLGFRIVRPVLSINSPDPDYEVKVERLEELKAQAREGEIILLFEDESGVPNDFYGFT